MGVTIGTTLKELIEGRYLERARAWESDTTMEGRMVSISVPAQMDAWERAVRETPELPAPYEAVFWAFVEHVRPRFLLGELTQDMTEAWYQEGTQLTLRYALLPELRRWLDRDVFIPLDFVQAFISRRVLYLWLHKNNRDPARFEEMMDHLHRQLIEIAQRDKYQEYLKCSTSRADR